MMNEEQAEDIHEIEEIASAKRTEMQKYVIDFPSKFGEKVAKKSVEGVAQLFKGYSQEAESVFRTLYSDIRKKEEYLPEGQRFHKGTSLYWWGMSLLFQEPSEKVSKGYEKLLLAFIEDLLDYPSYKKARKAPACEALRKNPAIGKSLLDLVQHQVENLRAKLQVPKNPEEVLRPLSDEAQEALDQPVEVTLSQVKPALDEWLKEKGPKQNRVFIGGNYRNIAILNYIDKVVGDINFVPIMAINFPETSKPAYAKLIHDISIEMLRECSFAIFEVTFPNGHLMEIERAKDFTNLKTILVYQIKKHGESPTVTSMLMTNRFEKKGYRNFTELTVEINSFLSQD